MGRKFLVIDDSALMRRVISDIITKNSEYKVLDVACNGEEGLNKLTRNPGYYDLILLDISMPKMNGGFNVGFVYGPWSLKARFMFRYGNKVANVARLNLESMSSANNQASSVNWRWRKDGDVTMMPRAIYVYNNNSAYNYQGSSRYVEDGSFVRFQNLQFGYTFDKKLLKKMHLENLRLYFVADNLYTWSKRDGLDPRQSLTGGSNGQMYSPIRTFSGGINITF